MATINTEQIDKINEQLDGVIDYIDASTSTFEALAKSAGPNAQQVIDDTMADLSANINNQLSLIRGKIVGIFHDQYAKAMEKIAPIEPILSMFPISISLDTSCLTAIVDALKAMADIITAPYQPVIEFTTQVIPKVLTSSAKLQTIASYQPTLDIPNVEVPPLELSVEPITAGDITG